MARVPLSTLYSYYLFSQDAENWTEAYEGADGLLIF